MTSHDSSPLAMPRPTQPCDCVLTALSGQAVEPARPVAPWLPALSALLLLLQVTLGVW